MTVETAAEGIQYKCVKCLEDPHYNFQPVKYLHIGTMCVMYCMNVHLHLLLCSVFLIYISI